MSFYIYPIVPYTPEFLQSSRFMMIIIIIIMIIIIMLTIIIIMIIIMMMVIHPVSSNAISYINGPFCLFVGNRLQNGKI